MAFTVEQTLTSGLGDGGGDSFQFTSWTPGSYDLVLLAVGCRDFDFVPTASGNGLTFVQVANVQNTQGQCGLTVFRAMGASPSTGQVTVDTTGLTLPAAAVMSRISGADQSGADGAGACENSANDPGPDDPPGDNTNMKVDITTLTNGAWAWAAGTHRATTFTVPTEETEIYSNLSYGTSGSVTTCSTWYEAVPSATTVTVGEDGDLSAVTDWVIIAVSIKPVLAEVNIAVVDGTADFMELGVKVI